MSARKGTPAKAPARPTHPREPTSPKARSKALAERAIEDFLRAIGHDPRRNPHLAGTGARVAEAWLDDLLSGETTDVAALLKGESLAVPQSPTPAIVILRGLAVSTMCPHHLLPATGTATVVYQPSRYITGLGTLAQLVDACTRRLTLQESAGLEIATALVQHLAARGAGCRLVLSHTCLTLRGERRPEAAVETLAFAGTFAQGKSAHAVALGVLRAP